VASIARRPSGQWRARYRDAAGKEHSRHFARKVDAQRWLDSITAAMAAGTYVDPRTARLTVEQARVHIRQIVAAFGPMPLAAVRPSNVKSWTAGLHTQGLEASYVYALHARLAQIMNDAVIDGIIPRSPCSRKTSPGTGAQRPYVATTEQVWALYDAMPERMRAAILLGAFAGLRCAEACGLRVADVDFLRRVINPAVQYPADPLKTDISQTPVPISASLTMELAAQVKAWPGKTILTVASGGQLGPWILERAIRAARVKVEGLPAGFRYHDLRHYFASLLIADGHDVKTVQARLRHASGKTTLDTYGHLWPDRDEATRTTVEAVFQAKINPAAGREAR
jgi:integrase